jgi:gentisate 1,2-dioxygenase
VDWVKGAAFVTPPGYWHEHVNASSAEAFVLPIQDAGLHTYLRTLDIQFFKD